MSTSKFYIELSIDKSIIIKIYCLFRDVWNIPLLGKVLKERCNGKYPARKSIQMEFTHGGGEEGLLFQLDTIAFKG